VTSYYVTVVFDLPRKSESRFTMYPNPGSFNRISPNTQSDRCIVVSTVVIRGAEWGGRSGSAYLDDEERSDEKATVDGAVAADGA